MHERTRGFTLIELLIVVAIIGIVAAVAVVALTGALQRSRQNRSMGDMRTIGLAVQSYATDAVAFPRSGGGDVILLRTFLEPTYIQKLPVIDGWSRPFRYASDGVVYTVVSFGADAQRTTPYPGGATHDFDADIVLVGGQFYQWPEGLQGE